MTDEEIIRALAQYVAAVFGAQEALGVSPTYDALNYHACRTLFARLDTEPTRKRILELAGALS